MSTLTGWILVITIEGLLIGTWWITKSYEDQQYLTKQEQIAYCQAYAGYASKPGYPDCEFVPQY